MQAHIASAIRAAGGWLAFDDFMARALYTPGWGYYASASRKFGLMPRQPARANGLGQFGGDDKAGNSGGGDFATAPEISPHFGRALARQVKEALDATATSEVYEFGAGTGALAEQILQALGNSVSRYSIVDVSGSLRERQQQRLSAFGDQVQWLAELPAAMRGVVLGNEVLDAMPVKLLFRQGGQWHERGVALAPTPLAAAQALPSDEAAISPAAARREVQPGVFVWADQPTGLAPPFDVPGAHDYLTEVHLQAEGFVRTLADRLEAGAVFLLDYGFPEHEYYHPQRSMGTVMCHRAHQSDTDPLADAGSKDVTAHINFTGIALAGQGAGLQVLGYTSQARFLINAGLLDGLENASLPERVMVQKLINEQEMGELFKVIAFAANTPAQPYSGWQASGFASGDRSHTL